LAKSYWMPDSEDAGFWHEENDGDWLR